MQVERRLFPRFQVNLPAIIAVENSNPSETFESEAINLSQEGAMVSCDGAPLSCLLRQPPPANCVLKLKLPFNARDIESPLTEVTIHCRLVVNRRLSHDAYQLGFHFIDCPEPDKTILMRYLGQLS